MSLMGRDLSLAPCGLVVERVETEAEGLLILARPTSTTAVCPTCGSASARIHSTYRRMLADLPAQGRAVRISVRARRFRCALVSCHQRIFTERLAATAARPSIAVIARDRSAGYIQAATEGRPEAIQVADRWHLMENASAAFLAAVQRSMREIRKAVGTDVVDPQVLSCAERRQHSGWLRREEDNTAILALTKQGVTIKEIVRRTNKSRGLVRQGV